MAQPGANSPNTLDAHPEPVCGMNTWMPVPARVVAVREENFNTRTYTLHFVDEQIRQDVSASRPGQFNMLYVPGVGEAAISVSSDPSRTETLEHTIRLVGSVTRAVDHLKPDGLVGLRGPFGRGWPLQVMEGRDVVIVAGGIGLAPLRPVIYWILQNRDRYRRVVLLYGCRTPEDRVFAKELEQWDAGGSIQVLVTVDNATKAWTGPVGVVTTPVAAHQSECRADDCAGLRTEGPQSRGRLEFPATARAARERLRQPGTQHELRLWALRALPIRPKVHVQGRPGVLFLRSGGYFRQGRNLG